MTRVESELQPSTKCRGAVLLGAGQRWEIRQIDLDPPRAGEVLVQMAVAGICHSDDHYATGDGNSSAYELGCHASLLQ